MELIYKKDALNAVLHNEGQAAVAAVQNIKAVIDTDAIDAKDRTIQGLLTQIERKDKTIERMRDLMKHYKAAYRTAYKLYQEARHDKLS
ncbi:MAG: hypothetical protein IIX13_09660 [Bacteroidales bacterium]|nr:hypothetical protein [Bacteroidales bacterium]